VRVRRWRSMVVGVLAAVNISHVHSSVVLRVDIIEADCTMAVPLLS